MTTLVREVRDAPAALRSWPLYFDRSAALPWVVAMAGSALAGILGWRGVDLPAQLFRIELFRQDGFGIWNLQWYGGHYTPGYSVLAPVFGAWLGPFLVGAASAVVATCCFERLARAYFGPSATAGATWFAVGSVVNIAVGRTTFALGMAVGLAGLLAASRGRRRIAVALCIACPLASPVAGVFLGLAAVAWSFGSCGVGERRYRFSLAVAAVFPVALFAVLFPEGGTFPFTAASLALVLATSAAIFLAAPAHARVLRVGALLYASAAFAVFMVPSPLGGNVARLGMFFAGPLLACLLWPRRRLLLMLAMPALLAWQWLPAWETVVSAGNDPSSHAEYFAKMLHFVDQRGASSPRVEIPFTLHHWESAYVAPTVPLARGWERQLDTATNPLFYDGRLTPSRYRRWLVDNAVGFVALPDVPLDWSSTAEARILEAGQPFLQPVWRDAHWQVWKVVGTKPLVEGNATLVASAFDSITFVAHSPGVVVARVHFTTHWDAGDNACVEATRRGWTRLRIRKPGLVTLAADLFADSECEQ